MKHPFMEKSTIDDIPDETFRSDKSFGGLAMRTTRSNPTVTDE